MSRKTLVSLLLVIVAVLLAVVLFIAGAIWRGRVTARAAVTNSRKLTAPAKLYVNSSTVQRSIRLRVERLGLP